MLFRKTDKGRHELQPGVRTLGVRERRLLLLADGRRTLAELRPAFGADCEEIALRLVQQHYLEPLAQTSAPAELTSAPVPLAAASAPAPLPTRAPETGASDSFEGKRSLATTRMFLFDICERMFARRSPDLAESLREALRHARDRDTMLIAARLMISEIEQVAGYERADSISERIAMLLPPESVS
jgi:hypothetical protein